MDTVPNPPDTPPDRGEVASLLELSDERDQWMRRIDQAWRDGWQARAAVADRDYNRGYGQAVTDWKVTAGTRSGGPAFAELDRRRYPPDGRLSWIQPQDDHQERGAA